VGTIRRRSPGELAGERADVAVVIDVLRMTSTASVLMSRDCDGLAVAATLDDLARLPRPLSEHVVVSELRGAMELGAWIDNSPVQATQLALEGRTPVLVTTNGTKALLAAAACADQVLLASFRDLHAVARHLRAAEDVLIVPAGDIARGAACIEDDLCAEALASWIDGREPDLDAYTAEIRADPRVLRRVELEAGFRADLDLALAPDTNAPVLGFQRTASGVGHVVRIV
jgi:phosphosulfolactate phosphohydrolase-like enzyme